MDKEKSFDTVKRKYSKSIDMLSLNRDIDFKIKSAKEHKDLALSYNHSLKKEDCPICKECDKDKFVNIYGYDYVECKNCGHIYLQDLIDQDATKELYLGEENKNLQHTVYLDEELFIKRVTQIANPKVKWISENIEDKGLWLDIGCGVGEILKSAKDSGYDVKGIDSDKKQIEFAQSKGMDVACDYIDSSNADNYLKDAKIVSLFNILEHLECPSDILKTISDHILPNSYVVIEVPRHPSISSLSNLVFNDMSSRHIYPPDHMHIFTEKSMDVMLDKCGLEPISIWTFGQDVYEFIMTALAYKKIEKTSFIENIIEKTPNLQKCIDENGLSDTMIVICRKVQ